MNLTELSKLLGLIILGDNRIVDQNTILYWEEVLPEWLTYQMAHDAVIEHRRTSADYLQPAHILAIAERKAAADREHDRRDAEDARAQLVSDGSPFVTRDQVAFTATERAMLDRLYAAHQVKQAGRKHRQPRRIGEP